MLHRLVLAGQLATLVLFSLIASQFVSAHNLLAAFIGGTFVIAVGSFLAAMNLRE